MVDQADVSSKRRIQYLRARGYSFPEIKNKLGISYRKVYQFGKSIRIMDIYKAKLESKRGGSHNRMIEKERSINEYLAKTLNPINERDIFITAAALYWAEGEKIDFGFSNSDPWMIRLMCYCLRRIFSIGNERIKVSIRIYKGMDRNKCIDFWSRITEINSSSFKAVHIIKGQRHGKLKYGMCRIRVEKPADLMKKLRGVRNLLLVPVAQWIE